MLRGAAPRITPSIAYWLRLQDRASRYGVLPAAGGLDDQDERIMRILDVIASEHSAAHAEKQAAEERKAKAQGRFGRLRRAFGRG